LPNRKRTPPERIVSSNLTTIGKITVLVGCPPA
jgi:hypothetical protein